MKTVAPTLLPATLAPWLLDSGSFMQRLRRAGITTAQVRVLSQQWQFPQAEEKKILGLQGRVYVLVREVLISSNEGDLMFARTVLPKATLTGKEQRLAFLKSRALGSLLFKDPLMKRSEFIFTCLESGMQEFDKIKSFTEIVSDSLWARRSVFSIQHKQLLLMEVFLPALVKLTSRACGRN